MAKKHQTYQSQYTSSVNITNDIMPIIDNPHLHINITHSNTIKHNIGYSIIPILITSLDNTNLFNFINYYININIKYKSICEHIEQNVKQHNINVASLTIDDTITSNTSNTSNNNNKTTKQPFTNIHQIFIVVINNTHFNKLDNSELLESLRVSGNTIFNIVKTNNILQFNMVDTSKQHYSKKSQKSQKHNTSKTSKISKTSKTSKTNTISKQPMEHNEPMIEPILEGLLLSSYKFTKYKTQHDINKNSNKYNFNINKINVVIKLKTQSQSEILLEKLHILINTIKTVFITRDLINIPANTSKSTTFINILKQYIKTHKLNITIDILDKNELSILGMGLLLGVGKGSSKDNEPKLLIMKYKPHKPDKPDNPKIEEPEYVLLGKGITFDTGGTNLKSSRTMIEMKTDLSGAATVATFLLGYAMRHNSNGKTKHNYTRTHTNNYNYNYNDKSIYVMCPFAENSIGPDAIKPSDILTSYNGTTVEITNTDAEGRLILADCLSYIVEKYPKAIIIDFATLTGQQESLSSKMFSNILSVNSEKEVEKLIKCSKAINELLVPLPLMEQHLSKLTSYVADIKNVSSASSADIIMSSLFMRQFIKKNTKWIHIDIAGPSYQADNVIKYASPEASGIGVRLLFSYFNSIIN